MRMNEPTSVGCRLGSYLACNITPDVSVAGPLVSISVCVNSEVSNEVEVTPGVLIRALRADPVGPCYTNYLKWFQVIRSPYVSWITTIGIAPPVCL